MIRNTHPLVLFLAALFLIGLAMAAFGIYFIVLGNEARSWPEVEGRVISTTIRIERDIAHGPKATRAQREQLRQYYPSVTYGWTVDGKSYTGSRYQLGTTHEKYRERADAKQAAARFPAGSAIPVYYDPGDPSQAVLDRSTSFAVYVPLTLGLFILGTAWAGLRRREALGQAFSAKDQSPGGGADQPAA